MDLQKFCDKRVMSGYGSALLYKLASETLYHILLPLETVPSINGSADTFDFDLLTCKSKGKVNGKESLDEKDVDFMWHRDNVRRLEELQDKVIDFMVVYQDFTARTFTGTIKVRPQDVNAEIMKGTFTITPMSASITTILDARDLIQDTIVFTNAIPSNVVMDSKTYTLEVETDPSTATFEVSSDNEHFTGNFEGNTLTITYSGTGGKPEYGVLTIKANNEGYASWTTSIALECSVGA